MARKESISTQVAKDYLLKFPNSSKHALAKKLYKEHPSLFSNQEEARKKLRVLTGNAGATSRGNRANSINAELDALKKQMPKGETEHIKPYKLPKSSRKVLLISDCVPTHSELLTPSGWVQLKDIQIGTPIMASDDKGNLSFSPILNKVTPRIDDVYTFKRGSVEMDFTENHRHLSYLSQDVFIERTTKQLKDNVCVSLKSNGTRIGGEKGYIRMMKLLGFCIGDGTRDTDNWKIAVSTPRKIKYLDDLFSDLDMTRNVNKRGEGIANIYRLRVGSTNIIDRFISKSKEIKWDAFMSLDAQSLDAILDGIIASDGAIKKDRPNIAISSIKTEHIKLIQTICHLTGKACTWGKVKDNSKSTFPSNKPLYNCTISKNKTGAYSGKFLKETKKEEVSCISVDGTYFLMRQNNNIIITGNCHIPYHSDEALFAALEYGLKEQVDTIIINGDLIDFSKISRHETDPRKRSVAYEISTTQIFLNGLRKMFPNALIVWSYGNHDIRYDKWIMQKAPELLDIDAIQLHELMKLRDLSIVKVESMQYIYAGKLAIFHGHETGLKSGGVNPARSLRLKLNKSAVTSHFHRETKDMGVNLGEHPYSCYSIGCLCDLTPAYMPINNWTHGFAIIELSPNGDYVFIQKSIINGKVF